MGAGRAGWGGLWVGEILCQPPLVIPFHSQGGLFLVEQLGTFGCHFDHEYFDQGDIRELRNGAILTFCKYRKNFRPRPIFVFQHRGAKMAKKSNQRGRGCMKTTESTNIRRPPAKVPAACACSIRERRGTPRADLRLRLAARRPFKLGGSALKRVWKRPFFYTSGRIWQRKRTGPPCAVGLSKAEVLSRRSTTCYCARTFLDAR